MVNAAAALRPCVEMRYITVVWLNETFSRRLPAAYCHGLLLSALALTTSPASALSWAPKNPRPLTSKHHGSSDAISKADCKDNRVVQLLFEGGTVGNTFWVWGSEGTLVDCSTQTAQQTGACVALGNKAITTAPLTAVLTTKQLVSPVFSIHADECRGGSSLPTVVQLMFVEVDTDGVVVGKLTHQLTVDVSGPAAPVINVIEPAETGALRLTVTAAQGVEAYAGTDAYCVASQASQLSPCAATGLGAGQLPDALSPAGLSSAVDTVTAVGLAADTRYACGAAGRDVLNNVGELSNIACARTRPAPAAGRDSVAGDCTLTRASPRGGYGWALGAAAMALVVVRRRRR